MILWERRSNTIEMRASRMVRRSAVNSLIAKFVSTFKRFCNREYGDNIWQARSYDHIIRDGEDCNTRVGYIYGNPMLWQYNRHTHDKLMSEVL